MINSFKPNDYYATILADQFDSLKQTLNEPLVVRNQKLSPSPRLAQILIGVRRAGKSTFLGQTLFEEGYFDRASPFFYLNLIDERLGDLTVAELGRITEVFTEKYGETHGEKYGETQAWVFDEIQVVPGWEVLIERLTRNPKNRVFITGSSAKMLSREIATSMRGRSLASEIFPFSFAEMIKAKKIPAGVSTPQKSARRRLLKKQLLEGGFPALLTIPKIQHQKLLQQYFETLFFRDLVERNEFTDIHLLKAFVQLLMNQVSSYFSLNKMNERLIAQGHTSSKVKVAEYLASVEDCFLAFPVSLYSPSRQKQNVNPKKVYWIDNGLLLANSGSTFPGIGRLLENFVFLELRLRGHTLHYFQDKDGSEVDFVVDQKSLIQVCERIDDPTTLDREVRGLTAAMKRFDKKRGLILTLETEQEIQSDSKHRIDIMSVAEWAKSKELAWLE